MTIRVAINGFGRIGRMILRALAENKRPEFQVVAINDLGSLEANAHLFKYDSIHGRFPGTVVTTTDTMDVGLGAMKVIAEANPEKLPWKELGIDIVLECSGRFTDKEQAAKHLLAGAKKVIVSAPSKGADATIVMGVNQETLTKEHQVISCGSCTTNCLAPVAQVLHQGLGIEMGYMTTIHAYTGDQRLVDTLHSDMHRARAAAMSMIPSTTGAAKALGLVLPELQGKLDGCAVRVPTANVSMIDLTFVARRPTTAIEINELMIKASESAMGKVLSINSEPLVSIDFNHSAYSSNFDTTQTQVVGDKFCRIVSWYDNEWGFSNRMGDLTALVASLC
ncbi:MAG: type I glyceraldehyde-3-phosphate dehydrogenase [Candidatus Paracaedibacteraceae bacterium]|nr:type I glyceraldehyde-3-phosphate dehydrogenase [Candidatus Paracaedibacteraceae bacterium]